MMMINTSNGRVFHWKNSFIERPLLILKIQLRLSYRLLIHSRIYCTNADDRGNDSLESNSYEKWLFEETGKITIQACTDSYPGQGVQRGDH
jgi:hypothetical protein